MSERKQLPESIAKEMEKWRARVYPVPNSYINFHNTIAREVRDGLVEKYGLVVHTANMISDGWLDGMKVMQLVIETKSGKLLKLKYHDGNQGYMVKSDSGGSVILCDGDLD